MALKQKLDPEEISLLEVIEDPIWLGEFLRSTADGELDKQLYPPIPWEYRDYQRQFLSDENEFILYTGGRAIGKCQPSHARIYTVNGYKTIAEIAKRNCDTVFCYDPQNNVLVQRRAVAIKDARVATYVVTTENGHKITATNLHPILTPDGYRLVADLAEGDYIAVMTKLPHISMVESLQWFELRLLGYILFMKKYSCESYITPRYKKIDAELQIIADKLLCNWQKTLDGRFKFSRKVGPFVSPITSFMKQLDVDKSLKENGLRRLPELLQMESLDNIAVFIEALFAQFGELSTQEIAINTPHWRVALDLQGLLLKFGIETKVVNNTRLETIDYRAVYRFWEAFTIPGVTVGTLPVPTQSIDATDFMRFERIVSKHQDTEYTDTYALHVYEFNNYISDNILCHNSVVLEDKMVFDVINSYDQFPITPEMLLVTANQSQMTPLQNRLILRFTGGRLLKDFLRNNINKSTGIMTFPRKGKPFIFTMRIAGSKGENNMVGLHIPKIIGDEAQLFPLPAYTQLMPAFNSWEAKRQQIWAGVPNTLRNSVLYLLDMQTPKYKKYRIPAPNNVMGYSYENYLDDLRRYGGESDDRFQTLVLGRHGQAAYQVIPRESIIIETFPFYNQRYNSGHVNKGQKFSDIFTRNPLPSTLVKVVFAIDTGFTDPTVINIIGMDTKSKWRTYARYRLTRIDFNEQQNIIHWLAQFYKPSQLAIDISAGGNGGAMMHNLMYGDQYKGHGYDKRCYGILFKENIIAGYDDDGEELIQESKSYAATELARIIQEGRLIFSEVDNEGISQMERIAKKKSMTGRDIYFVMSDKGSGVDDDDHVFAAYICFILGIRETINNPYIKKLGKARGKMI
jgi:hypothetical protein